MSERWSSVALLATVIAVPVGTALFKVWVYQDTVQVGYQLSERESERQRLRNELRQLEVELAAERSPARLGELARSLGLEPPGPQQIIGTRRPRDVAPGGPRAAATGTVAATPRALNEALGRPAAAERKSGAGREKPAPAQAAAAPRRSALQAARALARAAAEGGGSDGRP